MNYRPEVDGLRAVAVVPVILYHAGVPGFSSGFLGVDIFFVISGYLITSILITELDNTGRLNLSYFYERRARRILPALGLTVILTLLITPFMLTPDQIKDVGQSVAATAFFLSNYFFYFEIDYFNPFASQAPLLHTWSLAVEEQFYLFFPLLLLLVLRFRVSYVSLISIIFFASFTLALWTTRTDPLLSFYSIHTRAWELAAGSAVALWLRARSGECLDLPEWAKLSLFLILILSLMVFSSDLSHPGLVTLIPVACTALLVASLAPNGTTYRLLANPIALHIGLMSYGLYLYTPIPSETEFEVLTLGRGTIQLRV